MNELRIKEVFKLIKGKRYLIHYPYSNNYLGYFKCLKQNEFDSYVFKPIYYNKGFKLLHLITKYKKNISFSLKSLLDKKRNSNSVYFYEIKGRVTKKRFEKLNKRFIISYLI